MKRLAPLAVMAFASVAYAQENTPPNLNGYISQDASTEALRAIDAAAGTYSPQVYTPRMTLPPLPGDALQPASGELTLAVMWPTNAQDGVVTVKNTSGLNVDDPLLGYADMIEATFKQLGIPQEKTPANIMTNDGHIDVLATFHARTLNLQTWEGAEDSLEPYAKFGPALTLPVNHLPETQIAAITYTELEKVQTEPEVRLAAITLQSLGYAPR